MGAGHTPGPWVSTGYDYEEADGWFVREDTGGAQQKAVARVSGSFRPRAEIEANARLIAAAPELLEACQAWVSAWGNEADESAAMRKMEAAIAKARGEA